MELLRLRRNPTSAGESVGEITSQGLDSIKGCKRLKTLDLYGNPAIDDRAMAILSGFLELENLNLTRTAVTVEGLKQLAGLSKLTNLGLPATLKPERAAIQDLLPDVDLTFPLTLADFQAFVDTLPAVKTGSPISPRSITIYSKHERPEEGVEDPTETLEKVIAFLRQVDDPGPFGFLIRRTYTDDKDLELLISLGFRLAGVHLDLPDSKITQAGADLLSKAENLWQLEMCTRGIDNLEFLRGSSVSNLGLQGLVPRTEDVDCLRDLSLGSLRLCDSQLTSLGQPSWTDSIEVLKLHRTSITDEGLVCLADCQGLRQLWITDEGSRGKVSTDTIEYVKNCQLLERLDLSGNPGITDEALPVIASLPKLEILALVRTGITTEGLAVLKNAKNLRLLTLSKKFEADEATIRNFVSQETKIKFTDAEAPEEQMRQTL